MKITIAKERHKKTAIPSFLRIWSFDIQTIIGKLTTWDIRHAERRTRAKLTMQIRYDIPHTDHHIQVKTGGARVAFNCDILLTIHSRHPDSWIQRTGFYTYVRA